MHAYRQSCGAFALWKLCFDILYELRCKVQGSRIKRCYCNLLHDEPHCMGHAFPLDYLLRRALFLEPLHCSVRSRHSEVW